MAREPIRFVQAGSFHLDQPLRGLTSVPDHLRDVLVDAPFLAARKIFDTVVQEQVDFLILCGDLLQPQTAGPRAIQFLVEQFERLQESDIAVYWATGKTDLVERWPVQVRLPEGVHRFPTSGVQEVSHFRGEKPVATVVGLSYGGSDEVRPADFRVDSSDATAIAVAYGQVVAENSEATAKGVQYWALGGEDARRTIKTPPAVAHYSGTPQGRNPSQTGAHGAAMVQIGDNGRAHVNQLDLDSVRWHTESVTLKNDAPRKDLERMFRERVQAITASADGRPMLVKWHIRGAEQQRKQNQSPDQKRELIRWLQHQFGHDSTPIWTVDVAFEAPDSLPDDWYDEDTILGDFLRAVQSHQGDADLPLNLNNYLAEPHRAGPLGNHLQITDPAVRKRVLRDAALLGADLLRGDAS